MTKIMANGHAITFTDSASVFALPLNMNAGTQVYYFHIAPARVDSLELTYSVMEAVTPTSFVKLLATDIARTDGRFSFDSVKVSCKSLPNPCISSETTV